jgi:hypothetical protein
LTGGYTYLLKRDFRLNPLHPPLLKIVSALPLLLLHPKINFNDPSWKIPPKQWKFSSDFLYSNNVDQVLFCARMPVVVLMTLLGYFVFRWARELYGTLAGLFALSLYSFCPTIIAHSHLVTLDGGTAAFLIFSLYFLWRYSKTGGKTSLVISAIFMGAALASKYTAFGMLPAFAALLWIFNPPRRPEDATSSADKHPKSTAQNLKARKPRSGIDKEANHESAGMWESMKSFDRQKIIMVLLFFGLAAAIVQLGYLGLPDFRLYFQGFNHVKAYERPHFLFYLHGTFSEGGAWYYFPVTFLIKATAPLLILILMRLLLVFQNWKREWRDSTFLILPAIVYFVIISVYANPIGVRYLLPVFTLFIIFSSALVHFFTDRKYMKWAVWVLLGWHVTTSLAAFPNHLAYFNEFVGGSKNGTDWLDDSNVDWGQELKALKKALDERGIGTVTLMSFSPYDNPEYYGIHCIRPPQDDWVNIFSHPEPGIYVVSAHWLARAKGMGFDWKSRYPIIANLGNSMFVFQIS